MPGRCGPGKPAVEGGPLGWSEGPLNLHITPRKSDFFFFFWPHCEACGILIPPPGIEPQAQGSESAESPNHWTTREFPRQSDLKGSIEDCPLEFLKSPWVILVLQPRLRTHGLGGLQGLLQPLRELCPF